MGLDVKENRFEMRDDFEDFLITFINFCRMKGREWNHFDYRYLASITTYWKYCISNAYHIVFGTVKAWDT